MSEVRSPLFETWRPTLIRGVIHSLLWLAMMASLVFVTYGDQPFMESSRPVRAVIVLVGMGALMVFCYCSGMLLFDFIRRKFGK